MHSSYSRIRASITTPSVAALITAIVPALVAFGACTDVGEGELATGDTSTGQTGSVTAATAGTGTSMTVSTSSSTGSGAGGQGGASGCLDPSVAAPVFSIQTAELCVVASYTAPDLTLAPFGVEPTWGRHHGPLTSTVVPGATTDDVHLERWTISGSSLTKAETVISNVTQIPATGFVGAETVDLPFGDLTAISWSGQSFATEGGVLFLDSSHVATDFLATGVFGTAVLGTSTSARVVYTGLSAFNGPTNATTALYAADFANGTLGTSEAITTWGEATGPVAVDSAGNVIAINTKFSDGTQEIRGFAASTIASGQPATNGQTLLSTDGFGSALAALAPKTTLPGLALFQPQTGAQSTYDDVVALRYSVSAAMVTAISHEPILKLSTANTNLTLMTDDQDRIWVGAPAATGSVFYVLARP